ncbi:hypothetical protein QYF36_008084 [Acer negundo]|nr:hypothetical protein QYF36_008084 [Acer negundo]
MNFYGQHTYDEESKVRVVVCSYCGMQGKIKVYEEFSSQPEQEEAATIPLYGEIVDTIVCHEISKYFSSVADEELENEETGDKAKEANDVPFEASPLYKELKPYFPHITFSSQPEQEDVATFPLKGEEVEKEETEEEVKEAQNVPFEASLLYKELMPYVPPITFPSCLHKTKWNKWFSELISPYFIMNIYSPLLIVCRNMLVHENFF